FLKKEDNVLMLLRAKEPNKGKWNGVGGKIEHDETPYESCIREVLEETGLLLKTQTFRGMIALNGAECINVFASNNFEGDLLSSDEGILEWKKLDWILSSKDVVPNIPFFIEDVLDFTSDPKVYNCSYSETGELTGVQVKLYQPI
ncbi:NUDIX domain-containing protein, partial [Neobacillus niacini]|uniref:NUDIX hydrolase n=1 Tax=Neobacillus niacini TaxID=86668 RepID=UPI00300360D7